MKQKTNNMLNPNLFHQKDLNPQQITMLYHASAELIMKNKDIRIPKPLILDFLSHTISSHQASEVLKRPETADFFEEALITFIMAFKPVFWSQASCPGYVVDDQFEKTINDLVNQGINLDSSAVQEAIHTARYQ